MPDWAGRMSSIGGGAYWAGKTAALPLFRPLGQGPFFELPLFRSYVFTFVDDFYAFSWISYSFCPCTNVCVHLLSPQGIKEPGARPKSVLLSKSAPECRILHLEFQKFSGVIPPTPFTARTQNFLPYHFSVASAAYDG